METRLLIHTWITKLNEITFLLSFYDVSDVEYRSKNISHDVLS